MAYIASYVYINLFQKVQDLKSDIGFIVGYNANSMKMILKLVSK